MIPLDASVLGGVYFYRTDCGSTEIGSPNKRSLVPGGGYASSSPFLTSNKTGRWQGMTMGPTIDW